MARIELDDADFEPLVRRVVASALAALAGRDGAGLAGSKRLALTRKEAAAAIGISVSKLDDLTRANRIPHVRLSGDNGAPSFPVDLLEAWLREKAGKSVNSTNSD